MSRLLRDPEMVDFIERLQHTAEGVRYRRAWDAQQKALKEVMRANADTRKTDAQCNAARRQYIANTDHASAALGVVTDKFQWPKEAQFEPAFTYRRPSSRVSRPRHKAP